jgi:DNA (cytosine-5)-methyltransferase 1
MPYNRIVLSDGDVSRVSNRPTVCELFSGVGGLSLGATRAGFDIRCAFETDAKALQAHHFNFPACNSQSVDVAKLTAEHVFSAAGLKKGEVSGVIGGPPCQGFSTIGRKHDKDVRNTLFGHFFRIVKEVLPEFYVAENVPGILAESFSSLLSGALSQVEGEYYTFPPIKLKASDFGAPTSRTRVFFIGFRKDLFPSQADIDLDFSNLKRPEVNVREALFGLRGKLDSDWKKNPNGRTKLHAIKSSYYFDRIIGNIPDGVGNKETIKLLREKKVVLGHIATNHSQALTDRYGALRQGQQDKTTKSIRLVASGLCPTLRAGTNVDKGSFQAVRPIHHRYPRVITPREAARLQSFPDWFRFDDTKWHSFRQIGNSVPPLLAEAVLSLIYRNICGY